MTQAAKYLLGMSAAELGRLERQHNAWRDLTNRVYDLAQFDKGQSIIDLGCGPGFTSLDLADVVGKSGCVVAVDSSDTATMHLRDLADRRRLKNIAVVCADITSFDASPWKPDALFARWLFCFVNNPQEVVMRLASCLRPGGAFVVMDYWNYGAIRTEPPSPLFNRVFRAVCDSFAAAGGSLEVAGQLPAIFAAAGLTVTHVEPLCRVGRAGSTGLSDMHRIQCIPDLVAITADK